MSRITVEILIPPPIANGSETPRPSLCPITEQIVPPTDEAGSTEAGSGNCVKSVTVPTAGTIHSVRAVGVVMSNGALGSAERMIGIATGNPAADGGINTAAAYG